MPSIYISYRRDDAAGHAGRLYEHLVFEFGLKSVTIDMDALEPGVDAADQLRKVVSASDVVLVVMGRRFAEITDTSGNRRLADPNDFVRLEIRTALERERVVIPVLVGGAHFPPFESFPNDIRKLVERQSIELSDGRWAADLARLIAVIHSLTGSRPDERPKPKPVQTVTNPPPEIREERREDSRDLFISYVEEDSSTASALAKALRAQRQSTWTYEEDGVPGLSYLTQVFEAIDSCRAVVLVASATSVHARQVIKEVEAAHERDKMIIPVRIGLTHQELTASNPILRMAIGTAVTLSMDQANLAATATRIASALRLARQQEGS